MSLLPFIGYSKQELQHEHERGVNAAQRQVRETLYETLTQLMPEIRLGRNQAFLPDISEMIEGLSEVWRTTIDAQRRLELNKAELEMKVTRLEKQLADFRAPDWPGQVSRLFQQVKAAAIERDEARQELREFQHESAAKLQALEEELDAASKLIVKYETQDRRQKAKT